MVRSTFLYGADTWKMAKKYMAMRYESLCESLKGENLKRDNEPTGGNWGNCDGRYKYETVDMVCLKQDYLNKCDCHS